MVKLGIANGERRLVGKEVRGMSPSLHRWGKRGGQKMVVECCRPIRQRIPFAVAISEQGHTENAFKNWTRKRGKSFGISTGSKGGEHATKNEITKLREGMRRRG